MTIKRIVLTTLMIVVLGLLLLRQNISSPPALAPNISMTDLNGQKINLLQFKGQPILVTFWATDCPTCIQEIPDLIELYQRYHVKGLEIIAVAMYYDPPSHVVEMTTAKKLPYRVALDLRANIAKAFGRVQLTPTTFLVSPDGFIIYQITGLFDLPKLHSMIQDFLQG